MDSPLPNLSFATMNSPQQDSIYLGHLGPIPLYFRWSALFMVWMAYLWSSPGGGFNLSGFLVILTVLIIGIVLHELGHGLTARALGASGVTITLWAFGGLCSSTRDERPSRELLIIIAGPLVSFALAGLGYGGMSWLQEHHEDWLYDERGHHSLLWQFIDTTGWLNLVMGVFNSLPIYPLDGGKVVYNLILATTGRLLLARKVCLTMAVVGALAMLLWMFHIGGDRIDNVPIMNIALLVWLVYSAFQALA
jgi:Zn-dependent protease